MDVSASKQSEELTSQLALFWLTLRLFLTQHAFEGVFTYQLLTASAHLPRVALSLTPLCKLLHVRGTKTTAKAAFRGRPRATKTRVSYCGTCVNIIHAYITDISAGLIEPRVGDLKCYRLIATCAIMYTAYLYCRSRQFYADSGLLSTRQFSFLGFAFAFKKTDSGLLFFPSFFFSFFVSSNV